MIPPGNNSEAKSAAPQNARLAAVQMVSTQRVDENLATAGELIASSVAQGADLVVLPEYFPIMGASDADKLRAREVEGSGPIQSSTQFCQISFCQVDLP